MNRSIVKLSSCRPARSLYANSRPSHFFSTFSPLQTNDSHRITSFHPSRQNNFQPTNKTTFARPLPSIWCPSFWTCRSTWKRAGINTLRCLIGCTTGDFSALWFLQTYFPALGMGSIMAAAMASGVTTSITLETILLRRGVDGLSWQMAARTAMGMSMVSMLAMEAAENLVDYHLTGGVVALDDPSFWAAAVVSMTAGFLAPMPYNYQRLKKYGKACH